MTIFKLLLTFIIGILLLPVVAIGFIISILIDAFMSGWRANSAMWRWLRDVKTGKRRYL